MEDSLLQVYEWWCFVDCSFQYFITAVNGNPKSLCTGIFLGKWSHLLKPKMVLYVELQEGCVPSEATAQNQNRIYMKHYNSWSPACKFTANGKDCAWTETILHKQTPLSQAQGNVRDADTPSFSGSGPLHHPWQFLNRDPLKKKKKRKKPQHCCVAPAHSLRVLEQLRPPQQAWMYGSLLFMLSDDNECTHTNVTRGIPWLISS